MGRYYFVIFTVIIVLAGCSPVLQDDLDNNVATILADQTPGIEATIQAMPDISPTPVEESLEMETNPEPPASVEPGLEPLITLAMDDLAERLDITTAEIALVSAEAVVWPDASLGCPQPGMRYKQVPYDGALIRLSVESQVYDYHSGGSRGVFLCKISTKSTKSAPQIDLVPPPGSADE